VPLDDELPEEPDDCWDADAEDDERPESPE
jgi:hypothetical protein